MTKSDTDSYVSARVERQLIETLGVDKVKIVSVDEDDSLDFIQSEDIVIAQTRNRGVLNKILETGAQSTVEDLDVVLYTKDKATSKFILSRAGVHCPKTFSITELEQSKTDKHYFVKPISGEDSRGVDELSICSNISDVIQKISDLNILGYEAIIEEFIDGEEATVAVFRNQETGEVEAYPIRVIIDSTSSIQTTLKKHNEDEICIPIVNSRLTDSAIRAFNAIKASHYMRIDYRIAKDGTPYCIDLNLFPGLGMTDHLSKCYSLCTRESYYNLLNKVIQTASR